MTVQPAPTSKAAIQARLNEIFHLEKGWLDGSGATINYPVIHTASALIAALPVQLHPISICPTEPGGIELEWRDQHGTHGITVNPDLTLLLFSDDPVPAPTVAGAQELTCSADCPNHATSTELERRQRYAWSQLGLCPRCGHEDGKGRLCVTCTKEVRALPSPSRRPWRAFQPHAAGAPPLEDGLCPIGYPEAGPDAGLLCNEQADHEGDHRALAEVWQGGRRHVAWPNITPAPAGLACRAEAAALRDGAREAAAMLRRTPRDSRDYPAVLTGARVIEDWLRADTAPPAGPNGGDQ